MYKRITEELIRHLSTTEWKRTIQLFGEITDERTKTLGPSLFGRVMAVLNPKAKEFYHRREPSIAELQLGLERLYKQGWIEIRKAEVTPEVLESRRGHRPLEYRLTQNGKRRWLPDESTSTSRHISVPLPSPAFA